MCFYKDKSGWKKIWIPWQTPDYRDENIQTWYLKQSNLLFLLEKKKKLVLDHFLIILQGENQ